MSQKPEIDSCFRATMKTTNHFHHSLRQTVYLRGITVCFQSPVFLGGFSALDVRWDSSGVIHRRHLDIQGEMHTWDSSAAVAASDVSFELRSNEKQSGMIDFITTTSFHLLINQASYQATRRHDHELSFDLTLSIFHTAATMIECIMNGWISQRWIQLSAAAEKSLRQNMMISCSVHF